MANSSFTQQVSMRQIGGASALSVGLLWLAQPPCTLWPLALVALVPLVYLVRLTPPISRQGYALVWGFATLYWLVSLQGLRHAHWAMYFCWIALAAYLAVYHLLFLISARVMVARGTPLFLAIAVAWTGQEWFRGYLLTGISACMLGHTLADVPELIQIADLTGTYGVSFVIAAVNAAMFQILWAISKRSLGPGFRLDVAAGATLLGVTFLYGRHAVEQPLGESLGTFALVQRSEEVEYAQQIGRESEMFLAYANDTIAALRGTNEPVDAVIWPESMFTAGNPWMMADADARPLVPLDPHSPAMSAEELQLGVAESRDYFLKRASYLQESIAAVRPELPIPHLIVGSGVVHYRQSPEVYCGVIHISPQTEVIDWYGKTHLVMFGEYIPIVPWIPGLRALVPPELGLKTGSGPKRFQVGETVLSPNICIETAVERVTINQLRLLRRSGDVPHLVVTVTNDGWFDDSSVIDHHLRCAQLVAVGTRRPILSAANNGPTVWIDSRGQVVARVPTGEAGVLMARPQRDSRASLYLRLSDWPARFCALLVLLAIASAIRDRSRRNFRQ